jgi:hypothetical protein
MTQLTNILTNLVEGYIGVALFCGALYLGLRLLQLLNLVDKDLP